jgi:hypothetical protein
MATLSPAELAKRNNFNIFLTRIRTGKDFILNESSGQKVLLDKSVLKVLTSVVQFDKFKVGQSIMLPTNSGQFVRLTQLYKDSEFSGRTQATTAQEDAQIIRVNQQLEKIFDKLGQDSIPLKVGSNIYQAGLCVTTPGTPKSDFYFTSPTGGYVGFISHKAGNGARAFQQWAGTSAKVEPRIFNHPETQAFINTLREMYPNGMPAATTVGRRIQDENLKKMAVYGSGFGGGMGINNVDVTMQGVLDVQKRGTYYELTSTGHRLNNGDRISGSYEPVFLGVYKGDRSDHGIKGARVIIQPIGGRTIKQYV